MGYYKEINAEKIKKIFLFKSDFQKAFFKKSNLDEGESL